MPAAAKAEKIENGYRLSNELFEAEIAVEGKSIGVTKLAARGDAKREAIVVKELPITLRLATDAQRIDIVSWNGHAGSGQALQPEADWGYQLKLHENPPGGGGAQRLTDFPVGPPWYTDTLYPGYFWYRTMLTLPAEWKGKPVVFVLGGCDQYDWQSYWIYLNGKRVGQSSHDSTYDGPWHEVPRYVIKPEDAAYAQLKFGQPNQLSVQARGIDRRTPEMHHHNIERYSGQSMLCDQYVAGGEPTEDVTDFKVDQHRSVTENGVASIEMVLTHATKQISISTRYWLEADSAALDKQIIVHNEGNDPFTLLEADVMRMTIENAQSTGGGQGWPVTIGQDWFAGVAHPAGVARWGKDGVRLQVLPGAVLDPTHRHDYPSKTAVIGVGNGPGAFADYLQAHGRRKPQFLNMYSLYGLCEIASGLFERIELTEPLVMKNIEQMKALQKRDIKFDYYCIDTGWNDPAGDLKNFHPTNFPKGPDAALKGIRDLGMKPLLWISPAQGPIAFRGSSNALLGEENNAGALWFLCCAAPKWRDMLREAMIHHVKNNGVKGFKLDEVTFYCGRSTHGHLPNKYGIEMEMDAFIDTLDAVKQECPDLLVMLYWRFMSPWWLQHTDTIYERGLLMEGATPSDTPARLTRQSSTISLDQGHDYNWDRMPLIGQDSLGVWLSNTRWGSWMGAEGWCDAWIMDFVRGNMMHQLWGDLGLLNDEDIEFMSTIARWTKENSKILEHPKRILGSPWREEPYGYSCSDGKQGLIVIHNASFASNTVELSLDDMLRGKACDVRWIYRGGSVKAGPKKTIKPGEVLKVELGSFEVCMADIRPAGEGSDEKESSTRLPVRPAARRVSSRFIQTSYTKLDWSKPEDVKLLARIVNGRTTPTLSPDNLIVGPDRSDERDRDGVNEKLHTAVTISPAQKGSKLLVISRTDREGIAWHHLAPFTIVKVVATADGKPLEVKTNPKKVHEQAGGWSWMLHEFDLRTGCAKVDLSVDANHPKSVALTFDVWHSDE